MILCTKQSEMASPPADQIGYENGVHGCITSAMLKMFNLIDIGERAGSGVPNIFRVWREQSWPEPSIAETFEPARTYRLRSCKNAPGMGLRVPCRGFFFDRTSVQKK